MSKNSFQQLGGDLKGMNAERFKGVLKSLGSFLYYTHGNPFYKELWYNWKAGVTVSLVSVPLSISLAIAGGASPVNGIVTAFWAGIISAMAGGSHYNVVGPTGALSGVLNDVANEYADFAADALSFLAIYAGFLVLLVWFFKIDAYVMFIPGSVIHGFTVGVAFIIALNQLNAVLGIPSCQGVDDNEICVTPAHGLVSNVVEHIVHIQGANPWAIGLFVVSLTTLLLLARKWPKVPWAIIISIIGIVIGFLVEEGHLGPVYLTTLDKKYKDLDLTLVKFVSPRLELFSAGMVMSAVGVAFIAILETLISARIADDMTKTSHTQPREGLATGIANIMCGLFGGIPATAALARTALNIKSGATSRYAGIINCISLLLISFALLWAFKFIPMPTIGSLLVMVAVRMVAVDHMKHMWKYDKVSFTVSILTAVVCAVEDTMMGIVFGAVVSLLILSSNIAPGHSDLQLNRGNQVLSHIDLVKFDAEMTALGPKAALGPDDVEMASSLNSNADGASDPVSVARQQLLDSAGPETAGDGNDSFGDTLIYRLVGQMTYINGASHVLHVKNYCLRPTIKTAIISFRHLWYMDVDGVECLEQMVHALQHHKINVVFCGIARGNVLKALEKHPFFQKLKNDSLVYDTYAQALAGINHSSGDQALSASSASADVKPDAADPFATE
eukprot:TRINITY_DN6918_c0_g1_i1.p1 TRINITY_DN6918_c0_g1~~TRINITY_DN6918_c0_g1_i1.p1  ORF type:complete len:673 (-),score=259.35 TRINITY_DN6918_c0_g1_i1:726-2744(-)